MSCISVIVPVYRVETYLCRCVDSILSQTFTEFDLILVDDGSPDNCPAICDEYVQKDHRVHVIHQKNAGLSAARNAGIDWAFENSDSEWLTFIDSDDWINSRMLERLYDAVLMCHTNVSMCRCLRTSGEKIEDDMEIPEAVKMSSEKAYVEEPLAMTAWGKLYRKTCFEHIRYPLGKLHEDEFVTYRIVFADLETAVVQAPLYYYYTNPEGIVNSAWSLRRLDVLEGLKEQFEFFRKYHYKRAFNKVGRSYVSGLAYQYRKMQESSIDTVTYEIKVKTELRKMLIQYGKRIGVNILNDSWIYRVAFPRIVRAYWLIRTIGSRIKRLIWRKR